jgi:hypothetical protein
VIITDLLISEESHKEKNLINLKFIFDNKSEK